MGENGESGRLSHARYSGEIRRSLDEKSRISIPCHWQKAAGDRLYAIPDATWNCLKLVDDTEMIRAYQVIDQATDIPPDRRKLLKDAWFSRAVECPFDKQHRILVPVNYREQFQFEGEVVLAGSADFITVWRPEVREAFNQKMDANLVFDKLGL